MGSGWPYFFFYILKKWISNFFLRERWNEWMNSNYDAYDSKYGLWLVWNVNFISMYQNRIYRDENLVWHSPIWLSWTYQYSNLKHCLFYWVRWDSESDQPFSGVNCTCNVLCNTVLCNTHRLLFCTFI